ncbi:hypothetical protein ACGFX4_11715 [Kitasatospora sp. NPDC048365]|uniref:hypothetical protein n=1 Tax=Kitasatospora sp. NPDC048365 TaxID=3364050 RepID=UPI003710382C
MKNTTAAAVTAVATAAEAQEVVEVREQDPAGGITLGGRNRMCARARVLAGLVLTSGIVITLSQVDTSVSMPQM